jgi:hypothetical protein
VLGKIVGAFLSAGQAPAHAGIPAHDFAVAQSALSRSRTAYRKLARL